jgi:D-alanine-D-alanine ligase
MEFLPPVELDFGNRSLKLMTWDDKYHKRMDEPTKVCPAPLDAALVQRLNELALATFRACHLRDYARVDFRIDPQGNPLVLEINSMASLGDGGSYVTAAKAAGMSTEDLVNRILEVAHCRYFGVPAPRCLVEV